jgi:dolichyl-diphosphooligosaccharide--protein glycosyltransferase
VLGGEEVNFVETDAWYHVRLVENQVRHFPWGVSVDPYAAAGGQFVPIATAVRHADIHRRRPPARHAGGASAIERIAAFVSPVFGTLAVVAAWALGRVLFGPSAGLVAAALLATMPGHFLDRTSLGFVDHHALEALLSLLTLFFLARGTSRAGGASVSDHVLAGLALGLYLLTWASGAFFVAILGLWLFVVALQAPSGRQLANTARLLGVSALVALVLVLAFQNPGIYRYGTQVLALGGLAAHLPGRPVWRAACERDALACDRASGDSGGLAIGITSSGCGARISFVKSWRTCCGSHPMRRAWPCSRRDRSFSIRVSGTGGSRGSSFAPGSSSGRSRW